MLDAYSIKKIAPRILIGIILINLSLYLVVAATEVTRVVARGAAGLITQPFVCEPGDKGCQDNFNFTLGGNISGTQTVGAGAGLFAAGYFLYKSGASNG